MAGACNIGSAALVSVLVAVVLAPYGIMGKADMPIEEAQKRTSIPETVKSSLPSRELTSPQGILGLRPSLGLMTNSVAEGNVGVVAGSASLEKSKQLATKMRRIIKRRKIVKKKNKKSSSSSSSNVKRLQISSSLVPSTYRTQNALLKRVGLNQNPITQSNFVSQQLTPKENVSINIPKDTIVSLINNDINIPISRDRANKVHEPLMNPTSANTGDISAPLIPISDKMASSSIGASSPLSSIPEAGILSFNGTMPDKKQKNENNNNNTQSVSNHTLPLKTFQGNDLINVSNQINDTTTPPPPTLKPTKPRFFLIKEKPKVSINSSTSGLNPRGLTRQQSLLVRKLSEYASSRRSSSQTSSNKTRHIISEKIIHEIDPSSIPTKKPPPTRRTGGPKFYLIRDPPPSNTSEKAKPLGPRLIPRRIVSKTSETNSSSSSKHSSSSENSTSSSQFIISGALATANNMGIGKIIETIPTINLSLPSNTSAIPPKQNILPLTEKPLSRVPAANLISINSELKNKVPSSSLLKSKLTNLDLPAYKESPTKNNSKYEIRPMNTDLNETEPLLAQGLRSNIMLANSKKLSTRRTRKERKMKKTSRKLIKKSSQMLQNSAIMDSFNSILN